MNESDWRLLEVDRQIGELRIGGWPVRKGDRVRLRPQARGDVFDLVLAGKTAAVESIEQDLDGNFQLAVVLEDDPGAFLGLLRQPGHRFFFSPTEVEPIPPDQAQPRPAVSRSILVAGIGNIFLGDDGFGVEVAQRLATRRLPDGVAVVDYGIRGYDLAYALVKAPDKIIIVDACPRGEVPGTVFVLEPELEQGEGEPERPVLDAHDMHPAHVLRLARSLGAELKSVVIVGCEPVTLGPPEGAIGLSQPVLAAIESAVTLIEGLVARYLQENE